MRTVLFFAFAGLLFPGLALAQDDYDPEYDDEEAAGDLEYDDEEAVGGDWALPEDEGGLDAEAEAGFDAEASTEGEGVLGWEAEGETVPDERAERKPWEWGADRHHSTLTGSTGLLHMPEAGSGPPGTFGFGVHGSWFTYTDYLIYKDENTGMWGDVNIRVTPLSFLEIHYGIQTSANYNNKEYPTLFQTLGDMDLGTKWFVSPLDWWTLGLDIRLLMLNSVGEVAMDWSGTSVGFDLVSTMDFAAIDDNAPIRLHLLFGYLFDNASNLIEKIESDNGGCGTDRDADGNVDYQGCLSPVERTALGIDRNDQFRIGIGIDSLLPYISPMVEYMLEVPVNRQDFTCPKDAPGSPDSCMVEEGGTGFRQVLSLGIRLLPHVDDLAIDLGVDIGLTGYAPTVHEMAAVPPWRLVFGASYNFDPFYEPPPPPPPPPCPECPPPPPPPAFLTGLVHDEASVDTPVDGASITYTGLDLNSQVTGADGRFKSYELPAGTLTLVVTADGYHEGTFTVEVPDTGEVEQSFALKAKPKLGTIAVSVVDDKDSPIGNVEIKVDGPKRSKEKTDMTGRFEIEREEGEYTIIADVEGYLSKRVTVEVKAETRSEIHLMLTPKPKKSLVVVKDKRIVIKRKIHFETDSDVIKPKSFGILDEVVDTLLNHSEIRKVEIQGHTDSRGKRDYNVDLSERRARSVRRYLVESGVEGKRLESKGFGPDKPIAPNITGAGRARNRRVEFHILERAE
jgi:outer membrane protein OmpA-like peptidoglycan-associated protein